MDKKIILGLIAIIILLVALGAYFSSQAIPTFNITNSSNSSDDNSNNYQVKTNTSKNITTNNSENSSTTKTICKDCGGKGYWECTVCDGTGLVNGQPCPGGQNECNNGRSICYSCNGDGYYEPAKGDSYTID